MIRKSAVTVGLIVILVASGAPFAAAQPREEKTDAIYLYDGKKESEVTIVSEDYEWVKFKIRGFSAPQKKATAKIKDIKYANAPKNYNKALDNLKKKGAAFDVALEYFESVLEKRGNDRNYFWVSPNCMYNIGVCLLNMAVASREDRVKNLEKAVGAFDALIEKHPKTRFYADALYGKGVAQKWIANEKMEKELFDEPKRTFSALVEFVNKYEYPATKLLDAKLQLAEIGYQLKDFDQTSRVYKEIGKDAQRAIDQLRSQDSPEKKKLVEIRDDAYLWEVKCFLSGEDFTAAKQRIESLLHDKDASRKIKATCHSMLGDLYLGKDKKPEKAVHEYLKVIVLYPAVAEAQADARYGAAFCFHELYNSNKKDQISKGRAIEHYEYVLEKYPGARCAGNAEKKLAELG